MNRPFLILLIISVFFGGGLLQHANCSVQSPGSVITHNNPIIPSRIGMVNDYVNLLNSNEIQSLEEKLSAYKEVSSNEIVIIILQDSNVTIENFFLHSIEICNQWAIGDPSKRNGIGIVIHPTIRQIRINTGIDIENIITDRFCEYLLNEIIIPEFKNENYYLGLNQSIDLIIKEFASYN